MLGTTSGDPDRQEVEQLKREIPDIQVFREKGEKGSGVTISIRADTPPSNDVRVRQAVSKAIDRLLIIQTVMGGAGRLAEAIMSSNTDDQVLPEDEVRRLLARDVTAARTLLQQAGTSSWSPDIWVFAGQSQNLPAAELVQAQLRDIGITTRLQQMDNVKLNAWFSAHDLPIGIAVVSTGAGPNSFLTQALKTGGGRNVANLSDPELDRLIDAQAAELRDRNRRKDLLHQIQRRTIDLAAQTPLFVPELFTAVQPQLRNTPSASARVGEASYYEEIWLDQ